MNYIFGRTASPDSGPSHNKRFLSNRNLSFLIFALSILALFVNHQYFFYGHFGYDDMHYARLASNSLQGIYDWADHYNYRFTIILTTALSYLIFGINDFASALPSLVLSSCILGCFYIIFRNAPFQFGLSIFLYFSFQWNLFYSDKLMPDIYVSAYCLFAWLLYEKSTTNKTLTLPIISAFCLFLAFNAKGTIIIFIPVFTYFFICDLYKRQLTFWKVFMPSLLILLILYFSFTFWLTGDLFSRFKAISGNHYLNPCSYSDLGADGVKRRLTIDFYNYLISNQLYVYILIALLPLISLFRNEKWNLPKESVIIIILILSVNFMPVTLQPYNPFCLEPRHSIIITPILAISSVRIIQAFFPFYSNSWIKAILLMLSIWLVIPTVKYAQYCKTLNYPKVKTDLISMISDTSLKGEIYGSVVFKNLGDYYSKYQDDHQIAFKVFDELDCTNTQFICRNWYTEWHAGITDENISNLLDKQNCQLSQEAYYSTPLKDFWIYRTTVSE